MEDLETEWTIEYDNSDNGREWYSIQTPSKCIAKVEFSYHSTKEEREDAKANAELIAKAPKMHKGITDLIKEYEALVEKCTFELINWSGFPNLCNVLDAKIYSYKSVIEDLKELC